MLTKRIHKLPSMTSRSSRLIISSIIAGTLVGLGARNSDGMAGIFAVLVLSAMVVAIAQQTLP